MFSDILLYFGYLSTGYPVELNNVIMMMQRYKLLSGDDSSSKILQTSRLQPPYFPVLPKYV
jgi:hypothetical protein